MIFGIDSDGAYISGRGDAKSVTLYDSIIIDYACTFYLRYKSNITTVATAYTLGFFAEGSDSAYTDNSSYPYSTYPDKDDYGSSLEIEVSYETSSNSISINLLPIEGTTPFQSQDDGITGDADGIWRWLAIDYDPGESLAVRTWTDAEDESSDAVVSAVAAEDDVYIPQRLRSLQLYVSTSGVGSSANKIWFSTFCIATEPPDVTTDS